MTRITVPAKKNVDPPCIDRERKLLAGEVAALGLDTRCEWFACKTGAHPAHKQCARNANANAR